MSRPKADLAELEERLGYRFSNRDLLVTALTHVSVLRAKLNYQRLEFLGDRVLGLAIAELLYAAFPDATEGELSHRMSDLVRRESCAAIALAWEVGPYLKLGGGEVQAGGRRNHAILADVCESIIGAVFLDGGYEPAKALIERAASDRITASDVLPRDPKTALQEWAQGRGLPTPTYELVERSGPDHSPRYRIAAKVAGLESGLGLGGSKRIAEREAARSLLLREGVWTEVEHG